MNSQYKQLEDKAKNIRRRLFTMVYNAKSAHLGSSLSCVDILAALYFDAIRDDEKFILSKGHACSALYSCLAEKGIISQKLIDSYMKDGSPLMAHADTAVPGVWASTGSVGQGLGIATGMAYADKLDGKKRKTYALLSDGDLNEGSTWEAIAFAGMYKLDNLVAIIDRNEIQAYGFTKDVLDMSPLADKFKAFRWGVEGVNDGNSIEELVSAFKTIPYEKGKPSCMIANTIKGKGVSYLENTIQSHYLTVNEVQYLKAMEELK